MFVTVQVGDNFEIFVTDLRCWLILYRSDFVTNMTVAQFTYI